MEKINRGKMAVTILAGALMGVLIGGGAAFAAPPTTTGVTIPDDPTGGYMGAAQTKIQTWALTIGVPVLLGLTLVGVLIKMGRRWLKRAGGSV